MKKIKKFTVVHKMYIADISEEGLLLGKIKTTTSFINQKIK